MIYDCFTFFNELELLELRLHELAGVVDRFVLVEATRTFTNQPKPLCFQDNQQKFEAFKDRIIHVVVEDSPDTPDPWAVECFQRNCIARGLAQCRPDDWILVSDVDEIPRAAAVRKVSRDHGLQTGFWADQVVRPIIRIFSAWEFSQGRVRRNNPFIFRFEQSLHRYYFNCVRVSPCHGTRMLCYRDFDAAEIVRHSGYKTVKAGGWHFTSMGGLARLQEKIRSFSHQEFNKPETLDAVWMNKMLEEGKSVFNPKEELHFMKLDDAYPQYLLEHPEKFPGWIKLGELIPHAGQI